MATDFNKIVRLTQLTRFFTNMASWVRSALNPVEKHASAEFNGWGSPADGKPAFDNTLKKFVYTSSAFPTNFCATDGTPLAGKIYTYGSKAFVWNGTDLVDVGKITSADVKNVISTITAENLNDGTNPAGVLASAKAIADYVMAKISALRTEITTLLNGKANAGHSHEMGEVNGLNAALATKPSASDVSTLVTNTSKSLEAKINAKANAADVYSKTDTDSTFAKKADISSVYKPAGTIPASDICNGADGVYPSEATLGNVYNVRDAFTTSSHFVDGEGKTFPAGTNIVVVPVLGPNGAQLMGSDGAPVYKFDVLSGIVDLSNYATKDYIKPATQTKDGLLSASDKKKIDGFEFATEEDILALFADIQTGDAGSQDSVTQIFTIADDAAIDAIFESRNVIE